MKYASLSLSLFSLALAARSPATSSNGGGYTKQGTAPQAMERGMTKEGARTLEVKQEPGKTPNDRAFSIREGEKIFMDYGVSHTKEMHFIIVRNDLQHFEHLHPTRDAAGIWHVEFAPTAGGKYWMYADFVDGKKSTYTLRFEKEFPENKGPFGIVKNFETRKTVGDYTVEVEPTVAGPETSFSYKITDSQGNIVPLEQYLGARGHSVIISPDGTFIHAHASEEGEQAIFVTTLSPGFYRMFTQFQIKGKVLTVSFDRQADEKIPSNLMNH